VPVEPPRSAPPSPSPEPVNRKRAARLLESAPAAGASPAPALAPPWPTVSPPVFPQEAGATATRHPRGERVANPPGPATGGTHAPAITAARTRPGAAADVDAILSRGQAAFDRGNYPEAIRRAKEAMAAGAAVPGHLLVGDAYYHLQRYADALKEYEATLALEPSNPLARRGRELASRAAASQ